MKTIINLKKAIDLKHLKLTLIENGINFKDTTELSESICEYFEGYFEEKIPFSIFENCDKVLNELIYILKSEEE